MALFDSFVTEMHYDQSKQLTSPWVCLSDYAPDLKTRVRCIFQLVSLWFQNGASIRHHCDAAVALKWPMCTEQWCGYKRYHLCDKVKISVSHCSHCVCTICISLCPVSNHRCWTMRPAHSHRTGSPWGQGGSAGEARCLLTEQRAAPLALRDPGPQGPRCKEVLWKVLCGCYWSYQ